MSLANAYHVWQNYIARYRSQFAEDPSTGTRIGAHRPHSQHYTPYNVSHLQQVQQHQTIHNTHWPQRSSDDLRRRQGNQHDETQHTHQTNSPNRENSSSQETRHSRLSHHSPNAQHTGNEEENDNTNDGGADLHAEAPNRFAHAGEGARRLPNDADQVVDNNGFVVEGVQNWIGVIMKLILLYFILGSPSEGRRYYLVCILGALVLL